MSVLAKVTSTLDFVRGVIDGQRKGSIPDTIPLLAEQYDKGTTTALEEYALATRTVTQTAEYVSRGGDSLIWGAYAFHVLGGFDGNVEVEDCIAYASLITRKADRGHIWFKSVCDDDNAVAAFEGLLAARADAAEFRKGIRDMVNNSNPVKLAKVQTEVASLGEILPGTRDHRVALDIIRMLATQMGLEINTQA